MKAGFEYIFKKNIAANDIESNGMRYKLPVQNANVGSNSSN